jgi:hypothetical protein
MNRWGPPGYAKRWRLISHFVHAVRIVSTDRCDIPSFVQEVLKDYKPINQMFPSYVRYEQEERAREYFEAALND